jgi:hypothetical protein
MAHPETITQICLCLGNVDPFVGEADHESLSRKYRSNSLNVIAVNYVSLTYSDTHSTHILVLELLAAVCLVNKGHARVLEAFDAFAKVRSPLCRAFAGTRLIADSGRESPLPNPDAPPAVRAPQRCCRGGCPNKMPPALPFPSPSFILPPSQQPHSNAGGLPCVHQRCRALRSRHELPGAPSFCFQSLLPAIPPSLGGPCLTIGGTATRIHAAGADDAHR